MPQTFLRRALGDPATGWSAGSFGAVAEFMRDPAEPCAVTSDSTFTGRGGIALNWREDATLFASESPTAGGGWTQRVSLCLPRDLCAMHRRTVLTELGPDREGVLFDLGLDLLQADACIRTADPVLIDVLRRADRVEATAAILAASPQRVFLTRLGRVEVYQPIPRPGASRRKGRTRISCRPCSRPAAPMRPPNRFLRAWSRACTSTRRAKGSRRPWSVMETPPPTR
jgi:hypothetical protein